MIFFDITKFWNYLFKLNIKKMKKIILTESELKNIINKSIQRIINESWGYDDSEDIIEISPRVIKRWIKFNNDLEDFYTYSGEGCIYEDFYTPRYVRNFQISNDGTLTYEEDGKITTEHFRNDDTAIEWLNDFKKWLTKAKKYYSMNSVDLDNISDGNIEDI